MKSDKEDHARTEYASGYKLMRSMSSSCDCIENARRLLDVTSDLMACEIVSVGEIVIPRGSVSSGRTVMASRTEPEGISRDGGILTSELSLTASWPEKKKGGGRMYGAIVEADLRCYVFCVSGDSGWTPYSDAKIRDIS